MVRDDCSGFCLGGGGVEGGGSEWGVKGGGLDGHGESVKN